MTVSEQKVKPIKINWVSSKVEFKLEQTNPIQRGELAIVSRIVSCPNTLEPEKKQQVQKGKGS